MKVLVVAAAVVAATVACTPGVTPPTVPDLPATEDERLVAGAIVAATGVSVPVRCLDQAGLAREAEEEMSDGFVTDGQVIFDDETGLPASLQLDEGHCDRLAGYARDGGLRDRPGEDVAESLATLGHEYSHFVGDTEEDEAECHSFQYVVVLAPGFGATPEQALRARDAVVELFAPLPPEDRDDLGEYVTGSRCVPGGAHDLELSDGAFPPVGTTTVG